MFAADELPLTQCVKWDLQEQLARSLWRGHRVIHGVAGSGKTADPVTALSIWRRCAPADPDPHNESLARRIGSDARQG